MMLGRLRSITVLLACAAYTSPASANSQSHHVLPVVFRVARTAEGIAVADDRFLTTQLARANTIFAQYGVQFIERARREVDAPHAVLDTRADRDALAPQAERGAIDCFVVASLRDVDEPMRLRQGVHWRARNGGAHYVILSASAGPDVLAHELGHYLGNPKHATGPDNLMSYGRTNPNAILDASQLVRMKAAITRYLRRGELQPAAAAAR
jgi:hypothetical protein